VELFYLGLLELGIKQGDGVAIMGDPCPELFYADLAILYAGAISSGVYSGSSPEETASAMARTKATFFIREGLENADKILPFVDKLPFLLKIIVTDRRSDFHYTAPRLIGFADVQEVGEKSKIEAPDQFLRAIQQSAPDDPAIK
jgi:long-chain acyl-CoA synthetase